MFKLIDRQWWSTSGEETCTCALRQELGSDAKPPYQAATGCYCYLETSKRTLVHRDTCVLVAIDLCEVTNRCELWTHTRCCGVSKEAYDKLSREGENCQWWCPQCLASELPFADSSMSTEHPLAPNISFHVLDQSVLHLDASTPPIFTPGNHTYAHLNTQFLIPKWEEVQDFLERAPCKLILGLSETWLDNSVADAAISVSTCRSYRRDRQGRRGGGILVYVPETVRSWRRSDLELDTIEAIWIKIHIGRSSALLCNIYRPLTPN